MPKSSSNATMHGSEVEVEEEKRVREEVLLVREMLKQKH